MGKLKETEAALKRSLDEKGLTLRQSASDQEVISFLDSRTQVRDFRRNKPAFDFLVTFGVSTCCRQRASGLLGWDLCAYGGTTAMLRILPERYQRG